MRDKDPWYFPRGEFADELFAMFGTGLAPRVAVFAPRRKGKTWFLIRDLAPVAVKRKYLPVYASLWTTPEAPHAPIIDAVEAALETVKAKRVAWKRHLQRLQGVGLSIGVVSTNWDTRANDPVPATTHELGRLSRALIELANLTPGGRVLLMLDEAQHLATHQRFDGLTHCLRSTLDNLEAGGARHFQTLFTGSSRTNLTRLLDDPDAPFYRSFEQVELPELDQSYTDFVAAQLHHIGKIKVDAQACWDVFQALDFSPFYMELVIKTLLLRRAKTIDEALVQILDGIANDPQLAARWRNLRLLDRAVYMAVCADEPVYAEQATKQFGVQLERDIDVAMVQNALRRLRRLGLVSPRTQRGRYRNEDPELLAWLRQQQAKGD